MTASRNVGEELVFLELVEMAPDFFGLVS